MKRFIVALSALVILHATLTEPLWATPSGGRGGGGGGGRGGAGGGGGGGRPGGGGNGFGGGAAQRPGGGAMGTPSMSRPQGSPLSNPRPANPGGAGSFGQPGRPAGAGNARPGQQDGRPNQPGAPGDRPGTAKPGQNNRPNDAAKPGNGPRNPGFSAADMNKRPTSSELDNFLDLPGSSSGRFGNAATNDKINNLNNGDRINNGTRVNDGNRINNNDRVGNNRINTGDVNINAGNKIELNRQNNINSIQNKYQNVDNRPFDNNYWGRYGNNDAWRWSAGWNNYGAYWAWTPTTWAAVGTFLPYAWATPVTYNYGTNVVYRDNYVYVNDQQAAPAADYYQQANTIASSIPQSAEPSNEDWMPLGVFAIAEDDLHHDTGNMLQLAVSKDGIIAGTFYNETTQVNRPVQGTVDKQSQRAAWKFSDGKNQDVVMETAINNLTMDQSTALVHMNADTTQTWNLVRMAAPQQ